MAAAVSGLSPVIMIGLDPHAAQLQEALLDAALDDVLQVDDPEDLAVAADHQRRCAAPGDLVHHVIQIAGKLPLPQGFLTKAIVESEAPLRYCFPPGVDPGEARLGAEGDRFGIGGERLPASGRTSVSPTPRRCALPGSRRPATPSGPPRPAPARCVRPPGQRPPPRRLPRVMVPVLSRSSTFTSPAASMARPDRAMTFFWKRRSIPAMPMAGSSAAMVVGARQTNSATRMVSDTGVPCPAALTL